MKREAVLKIILVLIMGVVLFARPVSVLAVSSDPSDLNSFWEDQGSLDDIQPEEREPESETNTSTNTNTNTNTSTNTNTNTNTSTSTSTSTNTNTSTSTDIPKAGVAEDTMIVISTVALIATAIYAFKKVNDYKNI